MGVLAENMWGALDALRGRGPRPLELAESERAHIEGSAAGGMPGVPAAYGTLPVSGVSVASTASVAFTAPAAPPTRVLSVCDRAARPGGVGEWLPWERPLAMRRLRSYRFDEGEAYARRLDQTLCTWLAASLGEFGRARMSLELVGGEARISYGAPEILAALVADARFGEDAVSAPGEGTGARAAIVFGEPALDALPWDALTAPGVLAGDARVVVNAVAPPGAPGEHVAARAAALAAQAAYLERFGRSVTRGDEVRRVQDPALEAARRQLDEERGRLLSEGERAWFFITVEADRLGDLDRACAVLLGAMERSGAGSLAACPGRLDVPRVADGVPVDPAGAARAPFAADVAQMRIARFMRPPTAAVRGLSVCNANVSAASARPLASSGFSQPGGIYLGRLETGVDLCLAPAALCRHLVVTGANGTGKTTFTSGIVRQLVAAGIPVAVMEPAGKVEYGQLLGDLPGVRVLGEGEDAEPLRVNPFEVDAGVRPRVWAQMLTDCLVSAYDLEEGPLPLHTQALVERLYRRQGISLLAAARGGEPWPSARDLLAEVPGYMEEETCAGPEVTANVHGALRLRASRMASSPGFAAARGIGPRDLLARGARVLQLSDLGAADGEFAGMVLLARLHCLARQLARTPGARPGRPRGVIIVEEAHVLLCDDHGEPTRFALLYERALAELRSCGIGLVTVEQRPSLLPAGVLANSVTQVHFMNRQADDREAAARALGLTPEQTWELGRLACGEALVVTEGSCAERMRTGGAR